jgi:hypothetical protein
MSRTVSRLGGIAALALVLTAAGLTSGTGALAATVGPTKVAPHQWFAGEVNGKLDNAMVKVVCPVSGTWGRALPGQTLSVTWIPVIATNFGYTGSRGTSIGANTDSPVASPAQTIVFRKYNHPQAFPTNVPVPCGGTHLVVFDPVPSSHGSKDATVTVTYANVAAKA